MNKFQYIVHLSGVIAHDKDLSECTAEEIKDFVRKEMDTDVSNLHIERISAYSESANDIPVYPV